MRYEKLMFAILSHYLLTYKHATTKNIDVLLFMRSSENYK